MKFSISDVTTAWALQKNISLWFEASTRSTNQVAKELALQSKTPRLFLTEHQTAGRGRGSNTWSDQAGDQLLASWLFKMRTPPQPILAPLIGLSVFQALQKTFPNCTWSLKAPNDIYLNEKKIAGLLLESVAQGEDYYLIIGIGLNVWQKAKDIENSIALATVELPSETQWKSFLEIFFQNCLNLTNHSISSLSSAQREQLKEALNLFPQLENKYSDVLSDGSLLIGNKKIEWSSL